VKNLNEKLLKNTISTLKQEDVPEFNLFEGDNYNVMLKMLAEHDNSFAKLIVADIPYNTKTKQSYTDNRDTIEWLEFISKRFILARDCLTDDGIIYVCINADNMPYVALILDNVFGEYNRYPPLIWENKKVSGKGAAIQCTNEYVLVYAKNKNKAKWNIHEYDEEELKAHNFIHKDEHFMDRGYFQKTQLEKKDHRVSDPHNSIRYFSVTAPDGTLIYPAKNCVWTFSQELFDFCNKNGFILVEKNSKGEWRVYRKNYAKVDFKRYVKTGEHNIFKRNAGIHHGNIITGLLWSSKLVGIEKGHATCGISC